MSSSSQNPVLRRQVVFGAILLTSIITTCGCPPPGPCPLPSASELQIQGAEFDIQEICDLDCVTGECADSGAEIVGTLPILEGIAKPEWDDSPSTGALEPPEEPSVVEVHLDISFPMAGFLPPPSSQDGLPTFHIVTQNVAQHMAAVYGRAGGVTVRWRGVGHELVDLPPTLRIRPAVFSGRSTRLDLSIDSVLSSFRSGRAEAAAIVTDLMGTAEGTGVTGPLTVANALGEWLRSEEVRAGDLHVGLLGVKAEYWGVTHPTECPPGPSLGCWYDERLPGFRRLNSVERLPFYVLVLGRGADAVTRVLESLLRGVIELDREVEAQWELLTRTSLGFKTVLSCNVGASGSNDEAQFALSVDHTGMYCCQRDDPVTLSCSFGSGFRPEIGHAEWYESSADRTEDEQTSGKTSAVAEAGLRLKDVTGTVEDSTASWNIGLWAQSAATGTLTDNRAAWNGWSTESGVIGRTMQLEGFVRAMRIEADRFRLEELPPLLKFARR